MSKTKINPWSIYLIIAMMLGGLVIYYNYLQELTRQNDGRPPYHTALESDLKAVHQSGKEVSLGDLKGKVYLCNYIFTRCPGQCIGVADVMNKEHLAEWRGHPLFHMVSISLDPSHDTPEDMRKFAEKHELVSDQWWFLTGDEGEIRKYMKRYFRFNVRKKDVEERDSENDLFDHDPLIALVDHKARIRGVYSVYDKERGEEFRERLTTDLGRVMEEAMEDTPQDSLPPKKKSAINRKVEKDIGLLNSESEEVNFSDLQGKVSIVSHLFTRCPSGCIGVCGTLSEIRKEFGEEQGLMLASITMDAEHDTPDVLKEFSARHDLAADNWWFLTGTDAEELRTFMADQLAFAQQFNPEEKRTLPTDFYTHDFRVALMNHESTIINWFDMLEPEDVMELREAIRLALDALPGSAEAKLD